MERRAHQAAGGDDVGVGEAVADLPTVALGLDHAGGAHQRQVLRDVRLGERQAVGQAADRHRSFSQQVRHLEAPRVGEGLEDVSL